MSESQKINKRQCLETAVVLAAVLLFFGYRFEDWRYVAATFFVLLVSLILPIIFYPLAKLWFGLGMVLSFVSTKILLTIIFFLILTPVGIVRKWMGKDTLFLKVFKKERTSVLKIRNHLFSAEDLKHPY